MELLVEKMGKGFSIFLNRDSRILQLYIPAESN